MAKETILIKFEQQGSPELIKALKNLANAQKTLEGHLKKNNATSAKALVPFPLPGFQPDLLVL